ncbi:hypothetical protein BpHYR1_052429 [Brachionus plicatilis]|uniref:Uncharacterized protein n=1 Tax=Brachionus plicatilis TaxID=10195 RepID=A0A3M7QZQ2_BRAPC|nr:hypothetical protein BpHYR1_052429 [Brachionus plicatilis]
MQKPRVNNFFLLLMINSWFSQSELAWKLLKFIYHPPKIHLTTVSGKFRHKSVKDRFIEKDLAEKLSQD